MNGISILLLRINRIYSFKYIEKISNTKEQIETTGKYNLNFEIIIEHLDILILLIGFFINNLYAIKICFIKKVFFFLLNYYACSILIHSYLECLYLTYNIFT